MRRRSRKPTRLAYLRRAVRPLRKLIKEHHPNIRTIIVQYGITGTGRLKKDVLGTTDFTNDTTATIQIDTSFHSGRLVLAALLHEMIHAALPRFSSEHDKDFRRLAKRVGFISPFRELRPGPLLKQELLALSRNLGPYPRS